MKILLVEDDRRISIPLAETLKDKKYLVDMVEDGQSAWEMLQGFNYDLILLDIMLPKLNGILLCQKLRSAGIKSPVLMLTARDSSSDKVLGLDAGADDYVVKPFDLAELTARIRALLRRGIDTFPTILEWGNLRLNPSNCQITYDEQLIHFTPKEYQLLELFMRKHQRVLSPSNILDYLWSFEEPPSQEVVKVYIKDLRQKLKKAGAPPDFIETIYGVGYRLKQIYAKNTQNKSF